MERFLQDHCLQDHRLQHNGLYGAPLIRNQYLRRLLIPPRRTIGLLSIGKALQQGRSSDHFFNAD
jgi:hypothetical protein